MNQYLARINVLAQGHNAVTPVRLEPAALQSQVKHSTTEPLRSLSFYFFKKMAIIYKYFVQIPIKQPSRHIKAGHNRPTSEAPFEWRFVGEPIVAQDRMLAIRINPYTPSVLFMGHIIITQYFEDELMEFDKILNMH